MPNVNAVYQGQYLRAEQLGGQTRRVTIEGASTEVLGQGERAQQKIVLKFHRCGPRLPLNPTNAKLLASVWGPETGPWIGRVIELRPEKVMFSGNLVAAIRVYVPADAREQPANPFPPAASAVLAQSAPAPQPPPAAIPPGGGLAGMDDDVPW